MNKNALRKQKYLLELQKEILRLEKEIKYRNWANIKRRTIRNTKIGLKFMRLLYPYIISMVLLISGGKLCKLGYPFLKDDVKLYAQIMTEIDSLGTIRTERVYGEPTITGNLTFYDKWLFKENNYTRTVKIYSLNNISMKSILKLMSSEPLNIEEILGEPEKNIIETTNKINVEEPNEIFLKAVIYQEDKEDYIIKKETTSDNVATTLTYIMLELLLSAVIFVIRSEISSFSFISSVNEIQNQYEPVDIEKLIKKLEIKKDNYNQLVR